MNFIKDIHIENILNAILVNENIRPAMLIQPIDYKETKGTDKKTLTIVNGIKKLFPNLYLTDNYQNYQGTIISKKKLLLDNEFISLEKMGYILGYPCYKNFQHFDRDTNLFTLELIVLYNNNIQIQLFANVCENKHKLNKFNLIAQNAFNVFTNQKYKHILKAINININKVYVNVQNIIPTQSIINKLIINKKLTDEEIEKIIEILYNSGFSDNLAEYDFQYNNKIHKGILLDILLKDKYDILSPFYPLQEYPIQQKQIEKITNQLENGLIEILNKTKINPRKKYNLIAKKTFEVLTIIFKGINIISNQSIINKLITNKKLTDEEIKIIINILYNSGFSDNLLEYDFQYNNKIHKGILLDILLKHKYDILSPFYPLQKYPIQQKQIEKITNQLENGLIEILNKTKINPRK